MMAHGPSFFKRIQLNLLVGEKLTLVSFQMTEKRLRYFPSSNLKQRSYRVPLQTMSMSMVKEGAWSALREKYIRHTSLSVVC
jgi:hypothetical protein